MPSELLCSNGSIIRVPEGAGYTLEDTIAVITYAVTSTANSPEAAVSELKRKMPDAKIPSADTVFTYIYENDIEDILSFFRKVNSEVLALTGIPNEPVDVAVDFHDVGYYGDKNDKGIRGIKIRSAFLDREFFNLPSILTLSSMDVGFIMAARSNKRIKRMLEEHKRKNSVTPTIFNYRSEDKRSPAFYLVAIPNQDYDPKNAKKKNEFLLFATSINFGSVEEFVKNSFIW